MAAQAKQQRRRKRKLKKEVKREVKKEIKKDVLHVRRRRRNPRTRSLSMSPMLLSYCDAVVNPFGNGAHGAMLPDSFQQAAAPATDYMEMDIAPDFFNLLTSALDWQTTDGFQLVGAAYWFQPRCAAVGMFSSEPYGVNNYTRNIYPFYPANNGVTQSIESTPMNAYDLCVTGIWDNTDQSPDRDWGFFYGDGGGTYIQNVYYQIPFYKFTAIEQNSSKLRIVGAGIKLWSEEAPINTGGYAMGGWLALDDLFAGLYNVNGDANDPSFFHTVLPKIKYLVRNTGLDGVTVRYHPLQDSRQKQMQYARIPSRMVDILDSNIAFSPNVYTPRTGADWAVSDMITPGSAIPFAVWMFNATSAEQVYTLKLSCICHTETVPNGVNPFGTTQKKVDHATGAVAAMLEDPQKWPAATKGHSFKGFMSKAGRVTKTAAEVAENVARLVAAAEPIYAAF